MASSAKSPFAELSFTEQQEQWRMFRTQHLDFQPAAPEAVPPRPRLPDYLRDGAPRHANLDRVRDQLAQASRRAGPFQMITSREKGDAGCPRA